MPAAKWRKLFREPGEFGSTDHGSNFESAFHGSSEDIGLEIGRMAHLLFPGGIVVEEKPWEHAAAVKHTAGLMADRSVPAIFEAAFEHASIRVRVDVLERKRCLEPTYIFVCVRPIVGAVGALTDDDVI
jgi:hypothetical protein